MALSEDEQEGGHVRRSTRTCQPKSIFTYDELGKHCVKSLRQQFKGVLQPTGVYEAIVDGHYFLETKAI